MRQNIEKYELIEKYLNGQLTAEEVSDIEQWINADPSFANEVAEHQKVNDFINEASVLSLKDDLWDIHQKHSTKPNPVNGKNWWWSIPGLLFVGAIVLLLKPYKNESHQEISRTNDQDLHVEKVQSVPLDLSEQNQDPAEEKIIQPKQEHTIHPQIQNQPIPLETMGIDSARQQESKNELPAAILPSEPELNAQEVLPGGAEKVLFEPGSYPEITKPEITESEQTELNKFDCNNTTIEALVQTEKSCEDKPTGKLYIVPNSITGGSAPYSVSVINKEQFSNQLSFDYLAPNYYSVFIKDKNNCISHIGNFFIESTNCNYEAVFAPDKGEIWEIPEQEHPARLKVFNKTGQIVFRSVLEPGINYEWTGRTEDGSELPMGAYMFVIETDNKEPFWGTVTILK